MKRIIKVLMIGACAVFAEMSYGASSVVDELGYVPTHWYRFAVGARSLGSRDITWSTPPVGTVDADLEGVFGAVGPKTGHAGTGTKLDFAKSGWTIVVRGRMDSTVGSILFCLGDPVTSGKKSVSITSEGDNVVGVSPCSDNAGRATNYQYSVPGSTTGFHTYALQFVKSSNTLSLWVDGVKSSISFTRQMTTGTSGFYSTITFLGTPTGTAGKTTFAVGATTMTSAISDFRVYQRVLSEAEMKALANPPVDEIGYRPLVWYPLNESLDTEAASYCKCLTFSSTTAVYGPGRNDVVGTALMSEGSSVIGANMPWGNVAGTEGGDWTVLLDLKGDSTENAAYFMTGNGNSDRNFALVSGGADKVKLVAYSDTSAFAEKFTVDVPDASTEFHQYAIVRRGAKIALYVDGVYQNETERDNPGDNGFSLLTNMGGNGTSGIYIATEASLDDFRVYRRALNASELQSILAASRDNLGITPTHWYKFDASLASSGRRKLGFEGNFASAAFDGGEDGALLCTGDKPYGTNLAWRANHWTILLKARSEDTDNAVIASFGSSLSSHYHAWALASAGAGKVALSAFSNGGAHADLISDVAVDDASTAYHGYAIVNDGGTVSLWVDGVRKGSITRNNPSMNAFAFFTIHDGLGNTGLVEPTSTAAISDFRFYDRALTQREQAILLELDIPITAYWTGKAGDGLLSSPGNWACTNALGGVVENALPTNVTTVYFSGNISLDIPSGTVWSYKDVILDCTLDGDCDWSGLARDGLSGTVDVAGNDLTLTYIGWSGTVTDSVGGGTLNLNVASGMTVTGNTLSMQGLLKVVKSGDGTYVASKTQSYSGGTEIADGVAKFGVKGDSYPFGAGGSTIAVAAGAELDSNGNRNEYVYDVTLAGGTLSNRGSVQDMRVPGFGNVTLTADSTACITGSKSLCAADNGTTALDLGGYTLTVFVTNSVFRLYNCDVSSGSVILVGSDVTLTLADDVRAQNTTFDVDGSVAPYSAATVGNFTIRQDHLYQSDVTNIVSVCGTFTPLTDRMMNVRLMDGATLCLEDRTDVYCAYNVDHADRLLTFADNATVKIKLGNRVVANGTKIVGWATAPMNLSGLTFKPADGEDFGIVKKNDGLYVVKGFLLIVQ